MMQLDNETLVENAIKNIEEIRLATEKMNVEKCLLAAIEAIIKSKKSIMVLGEYITKINKSDKIPGELTQIALFGTAAIALIDAALMKYEKDGADDAACVMEMNK